jgi:hypothetical protein
MALQLFVGPWSLLQFRNRSFFFTQTVGLFGRGISPSQGRYLQTGQHKHRINAHTDIHALSGIRTTITVFERTKTFHVLDRAATVTGDGLEKELWFQNTPASLQTTLVAAVIIIQFNYCLLKSQQPQCPLQGKDRQGK